MAISPTYPLLPYSQLVYDMLQLTPEVYTTRFSLCIKKTEVDVVRLRSSIEKALRNHPAFSMRVDEHGRQYFIQPIDIFQGPYHSIDFQDKGDNVEVDVAYNRILGDSKSELVFFVDVIRLYQGLPVQTDSYLDYLGRVEQYKQSHRYAANRQWLKMEYGHLSCPVHPQTDVPLNPDDFGQEGVLIDDYTCMCEALARLAEEHLLSLTAVFSLASALAMMEYNGTDEAALTWAYDGRERPEEQHIYGSLHRDVPFKIKVDGERLMVKEDLIRETRKQFREGIAHSTYPYTLTKPQTDIWNYALNVLVRPSIEDMDEIVLFPFEALTPAEEQKPAYALLDVEILDAEQLHITYRYSALHYKPESIRKFADLVRKYVEWLID